MKDTQIIYYLDDDIDDLHFFKDMAESLGHEVSIFINGNVLMKALEKQTPDIIFLDIHMPVFNGEEILSVIKKSDEWKDIPVVMISGTYPRKIVQDYLDAGANYFMKKPMGTDWKITLQRVLDIEWPTYRIAPEDWITQ